MASEILSVQSRLKEAEKDALDSTIDLIQVVKGSCDDRSQKVVWKLTIAAYGCDEYVIFVIFSYSDSVCYIILLPFEK